VAQPAAQSVRVSTALTRRSHGAEPARTPGTHFAMCVYVNRRNDISMASHLSHPASPLESSR